MWQRGFRKKLWEACKVTGAEEEMSGCRRDYRGEGREGRPRLEGVEAELVGGGVLGEERGTWESEDMLMEVVEGA